MHPPSHPVAEPVVADIDLVALSGLGATPYQTIVCWITRINC
jgi:hypothetical protein